MKTSSASQSSKTFALVGVTSRFALAIGCGVLLAAAFGTAKPPQAAASPAAASAGSADNGKKLFVADGCYECHGYGAQGGSAGPRLGPHPIPMSAVIHELRHPNEMPPFEEKVITDEQIADIYAFLQSLPDPPKVDTIPLLSKQ